MTLRNRFSNLIPNIRASTSQHAKNASSNHEELILGVWRVLIAKGTRFWLPGLKWDAISTNLPLLRRAFWDVYAISPPLFIFTILTHMWYAIEEPLSLYFSNRLLFFGCQIERRIVEGPGDGQSATDLYWATIVRVMCSVFTGLVKRASEGRKQAYSARVKYEFQARLFAASSQRVTILAKLARDLPTSQENATRSQVDADSVYDCLERTLEMIKTMASFLLQLRLIMHIIGTGLGVGGPIFITLSVLPLLARSVLGEELWGRDGLPIEQYRMEELRSGIAVLTQEHQLFPLSVEENIALGACEEDAMVVKERLRESTRLAGAEGIVKNFKDGFDTVLDPVSTGYLSYSGNGNEELEEIYKNMEKSANVSGGEKQRLVAARTFMRLLSSPVKLVTVDEPSSALDPEGEYQLFARLREARKGRTMIFVTHRFGHLTRYADLIVCIKDGAVVETGTHADLLAQAGEYAHLYNVQAQAFTAV
ncbi:hypothetical protein HYDPIDRAFT_170928 [Hydnomerulius pinastri MD-312]|uniref:ABC transporter domain-containing protein n=1 Tax=Hydnomerulius pinastri MD-312 TaxID=994086 RepID=A0A0C9W895_9AGAM|nr:hypothetical protein HYDPIDRAFT_170928 [Hydnomerulius pinastri MD-312]